MVRPPRKMPREALQLKTGELYSKGFTQHEIAEICGVSQLRVSKALEDVRAQWFKQAYNEIEPYIIEENKKLQMLEKEAWIQWDSQKTSPRIIDNDGNEVYKYPSHQYLLTILRCIELRYRLFGLEARDVRAAILASKDALEEQGVSLYLPVLDEEPI